MKKALLILLLSLSITTFSTSLVQAWPTYLSASGYDEYGSPYETGNDTFINVNAYTQVIVTGGITNETPGIGAFCYTDVRIFHNSYNDSRSYRYGGYGTDGPNFYFDFGVDTYGTIAVNLEVYGLDTYTTVYY